MADEVFIDGVDHPTADVEETGDEDQAANNSKLQAALMQKIEKLEQENRQLKDEIDASKNEKADMRAEIDKFESDRKTLESIAGHAAELETEVARLQHDLISSMNESQEANAELSQLKRMMDEVKIGLSEKGEMVEILEKERNLLLERMDKENESKNLNESRIRDLEIKIEALEARENSQKNDRVRVDEEKEDQLRNLKNMVDEFQVVVGRNRVDLERSNKEKEELEIGKNDLEALLKKSERKVKEMEQKIDQLHKELEASENMISVLKEKTVHGINGVVDRGMVLDQEKRLMGLKLDWPVMAASAGAIAAVAVVYLRCAK